MSGIAADRIGFTRGDAPSQKRCEVLARFVARVSHRCVGAFEEFSERHEAADDRRVLHAAQQVGEERTADVGPARDDQAGSLILIHRLGEPLRQSEITRCAIGRDRQSRDRVDRRVVAAFPAELAVLGVWIDAVVEQEVTRPGITELRQHLREQRVQTESTPSPRRRLFAKESLVGRSAAADIVQDRFERQQWRRHLGPLAAEDFRCVALHGFAEQIRDLRLVAREFIGIARGHQKADRLAVCQQRREFLVRHVRHEQAHVEQVRIGRIEPLTRFVQRLEAVREPLLRVVQATGDECVGTFYCFATQTHLINLAEVVHLS